MHGNLTISITVVCVKKSTVEDIILNILISNFMQLPKSILLYRLKIYIFNLILT